MNFSRCRACRSINCASPRISWWTGWSMGLAASGFGIVRAHFPRCYVDVNREPYELDPRMFEGRLPSFANTRSMRVAGGLGTIARVVGDAQEIYRTRLAGGRGPAPRRERSTSPITARCAA
jgi:N-formylglutamate amidohydrolase